MDAKEFVTSHPNTSGPKPALYPDGTRVRLCAMPENDVGEEDGVVLSYDWHEDPGDGYYMYVVEVDQQFRDGPTDDGLRELSEDQIIGVLKKDS